MSTEYENLVNRAETAATNAANSSKAAQEALAAAQQLTTVINEQQAVSINSSKEAIRQAIVSKGQACDTSVAFDQYAGKISAIYQGVDTSSDTVTADKMLEGTTAHNATGNQITGNIVSRSLPNLSLAVDADSGRITATYTAETGYYKAGTVDAAETMDTQAAKTYTPSTQDQRIDAYKFLTGTQTIKGDSNLVAENIKKGVTVFGVNGSYEESASAGACKYYECTFVDNGKDIPAIPAIPAGIVVTGFTDYYEGFNGHYTLQGTFTTMKEAVWKHDTQNYYIGYSNDYSYWCFAYGTDFYPWGAPKYIYSDGSKAPWEYDWSSADGEAYSSSIKLTGSFEDTPEVPMIPGTGVKSWSGYEWLWAEEVGYYKASNLTTGLSWTINMPEVGNTYTEDGLVQVKLMYNTESATPLTFTAEQANSTVKLAKGGTVDTSGLQYRCAADDEWATYTIGTNITLMNTGDIVQFKNTKSRLSDDGNNYINVQATGKIAASGNIHSMLNYEENCGDNAFVKFFENCTALTQAPNLPAKIGGSGCYSHMFNECSSLRSMPVISATKFTGDNNCHRMFGNCRSMTTATALNAEEIGRDGYAYMFSGCSALEMPPELKATKFGQQSCRYMFENCSSLKETPHFVDAVLSDNCYEWMFYGCSSLVTAHALPSTTLATYCYYRMFSGIASLKTAPELKAKTLAPYCYRDMFNGCTALETVPDMVFTELADHCCDGMFSGCTSLTTAPELPATTLAEYCYLYMFSSCTSLTTAPDLPATTLADHCYSGMFSSCTSLTTAPDLPATTLAPYCYYQMFQHCSNLEKAPFIAAATTADSSLINMFAYCSKLNEVKVMFTSWNDAMNSWLAYVSSTGTFYKPDELPEEFGSNRIPSGWTVKSINESEEPEQPEVPEVPGESVGTYLRISGSSADNEGLAGVYKLNEAAVTDIYKEWIKQGDDTKKVRGDWVDIDNQTYWTVYGGSDNYSAFKNESALSYPWNEDNSSLVWYYHGEIVDFQVTPYESDEEEPSMPETPSDPEEPDTPTLNGYTVVGSNNPAANGNYLQAADMNGAPAYKHESRDIYICKWIDGDFWLLTTAPSETPGQALYYAEGSASADPAILSWNGITVTPYSGTGADTPTTNTAAFRVVHTDAGTIDFSGNYVDNNMTYSGYIVYIHEDDVNKADSDKIRTAYSDGSYWRLDYTTRIAIDSHHLYGGLPCYEANSSSASPVGLTFNKNSLFEEVEETQLPGTITVVAAGSDNDTESPVKLVVSGFSAEESFYVNVADMNGTYTLVDETATGTARVWQHQSEAVYVKYSAARDVWTIALDTQDVGMNRTEATGTSDPYNADGSSLQWMFDAGISFGTVTKN